MGWTHCWRREIELSTDKFRDASRDFQRVLTNLDIELAGEDGTGQPVLSESEIIFNGVSGQGCEPFVIKAYEPSRRSPARTFSFCKTQVLSYDKCVQVALIILKHHLGENIEVSSDGKIEDWADAIQFCLSHLGYGNEFKLSKSE